MKDSEDTSAVAEPSHPPASPTLEDRAAADTDVPQIVMEDQDGTETATELAPVVPTIHGHAEAEGGRKGSDSESVDINSVDDLPDRTASPAGSLHSDANLTPSIIVSFGAQRRFAISTNIY